MVGLAVLFISLLVGGAYYYFQNQKQRSETSNLTPTPSIEQPSPTPNLMADWQTYTNTKFGFLLKVPVSYQLPSATTDFGKIGDKIDFGVSNNSISNCTGDCPVIENAEKTNAAGISSTKIEGYAGEIGGCVAMRYITYEFQKDSNFISITLNATNCNNYRAEPEGIVGFKDEDIQIFDQILSTFKFTDSSVGEFVCPESETLDCTPCTSDMCPLYDPAYCSKGSAYYNFIIENCPDTEIVGIE